MELIGNYKGNYMDTYGVNGLSSETCSAFTDPSPDQKQSRPAAIQWINTESSSLLCHFNEPKEPKLEAIVCFRQPVSYNFVPMLVLGSIFLVAQEHQ